MNIINHRLPRCRKQGFTLLEIMIAVALLSACTAMATAGFARVINVAIAASRSGVMNRELRHGMSMLSRDILEAKNVHSYGWNDFIILHKTNAGGDFYVYYLIHNRSLYRFTSITAGSQILGRNMNRLRLDYFDLESKPVASPADATIVNVRLGGLFTHRKRTYTDTLETRVRLRNKSI